MFCPKCGNELYSDTIFCSKCGAKMIESENKTKENQSLNISKTPDNKILLIELVDILFIVGMIFYFYMNSPKLTF